jgi:2-polyprenyl-6-methoxyphenol hydroxylase-like FAD-dependent oxidoreductase
MTHVHDSPVLVVGGGPTGLVLASVLSRHGVRCLLVERNAETTRFPKMDITNGASMELLRRLGVDGELRSRGVAAEHSFDVVFAPSLRGPEIARWQLPSVDEQRAQIRRSTNGACPAQPWQRCSQEIFEAVMMERCKQDPLIDVRQGWRLQTCVQSGDGVESTIVDDNGSTEAIRSDYVVGCDGASSQVRRELGIEMQGAREITTFALVHFRSADLTGIRALGQFWHLYTSGGAVVIAQDEVDTWTMHVDLGLDVQDPDPIGDPHEFVAQALGQPIVIDSVLASSVWRPTALTADHYGRDRILLAGDSAHTMVPTGGYGMNTGIGDAFNLGWKLAATVHGWGGRELLQSYEVERRPIGERNSIASLENAMVQFRYRELVDHDLIGCDSAEGRAHRAAVAEFVHANDAENVSLGIELDIRYDTSPIVCDAASDPPPWDRRCFVPTVRPGHRAPNVALGKGETLFDRFGPWYTLLDAAGEPNGATRLLDEAEMVGVPIRHLTLDDSRLRELYLHSLVLIRPDFHIAWSGLTVDEPADIIARIRGAG